jgi:predicted DNA-binding protein
LHCVKDAQVTFRLPRRLARALARRARERGVPKSHLVREVLEAYLLPPPRGERFTLLPERYRRVIAAPARSAAD